MCGMSQYNTHTDDTALSLTSSPTIYLLHWKNVEVTWVSVATDNEKKLHILLVLGLF